MYYLLQHHGRYMSEHGGPAGREAVLAAGRAMLRALQVRGRM